MQNLYNLLNRLAYQTDLQFGLKANPILITGTSNNVAGTGFFYYGLQADNTAAVVIDTAKDINGNLVIDATNFEIPAGGRLDGAFSEIKLASGVAYVQKAKFFELAQE